MLLGMLSLLSCKSRWVWDGAVWLGRRDLALAGAVPASGAGDTAKQAPPALL